MVLDVLSIAKQRGHRPRTPSSTGEELMGAGVDFTKENLARSS